MLAEARTGAVVATMPAAPRWERKERRLTRPAGDWSLPSTSALSFDSIVSFAMELRLLEVSDEVSLCRTACSRTTDEGKSHGRL